MARPVVDQTDVPSCTDPHRSVPAPFLTKTYKIVDDPSTDSIISWNENGTTFVVWHPPEFARDLLPNYFKHNNFSSFVRQLNTYGFRKIVPDRWEFANEFFKKDEKHLLVEIHRRKASQPPLLTALPSKRSSSLGNSSDEQSLSSNSSPLSSPRRNGVTLFKSDETERLKKENLLLVSELSSVRRLCSDLLLFIQKRDNVNLQDLGSINKLLHTTQAFSEHMGTEEVAASFGECFKQLDGTETTREGHSVPFSQEISSKGRHNAEKSPTEHMELQSLSVFQPDKNLIEAEPARRSNNCTPNREGDGRSAPRLFGVPLKGKIRSHPLFPSDSLQSWWSNISENQSSAPPNKLGRTTSDRGRTTATEAPWELSSMTGSLRSSAAIWLRFFPSPDERVCN